MNFVRVVLLSWIFLFSILSSSCAHSKEVKPCVSSGEAICFTNVKTKLEKTGGIHDFNIYSASYDGIYFNIYEGGHSQFNKDKISGRKTKFNGHSVLYYENKTEGKFEVLISRKTNWPSEIHIWVNSGKSEDIVKFQEALQGFSFIPK